VTFGFVGFGELRTTMAHESPAFALISLLPIKRIVQTVEPEN